MECEVLGCWVAPQPCQPQTLYQPKQTGGTTHLGGAKKCFGPPIVTLPGSREPILAVSELTVHVLGAERHQLTKFTPRLARFRQTPSSASFSRHTARLSSFVILLSAWNTRNGWSAASHTASLKHGLDRLHQVSGCRNQRVDILPQSGSILLIVTKQRHSQ